MRNLLSHRLFFSLAACFLSLSIYSQSSFLLMGGQEFNGKILEEKEEYLVCEIAKKNGKKKIINLDIERIFSITTDSVERVYYRQDPQKKLNFTAEEMRYYIYGQQDARANHKTLVPVIVSAAISGVITFALAQQDNALLITGPIAGSLVGSLSQGDRPKQKNARDAQALSQPSYVEGYRKTARSKKILNSLGAAIAAGIAGAVSGTIIANN